jgi:hypothetical protein
MIRRALAFALSGTAALVASVVACGAAPVGTIAATGSPGTPIATTIRSTPDSTASAWIPVGYGSLRQDDISIVLQPNGVRVTAIPLEEPIIRTLAPDSYHALHAIAEARHDEIVRRGQTRGVRDPKVWYVSFTGLVPDARFVPTDMTVSSGGRDYRPIDVIGLTPAFSEQRVQPREIQRCLLLFDDQLDMSQPVTVTMGTERNTDWEGILQKLETARAEVRARAAGHPPVGAH